MTERGSRGISVIEIVVAVSILVIATSVALTSLFQFNNAEALQKDRDLIASTLNTARNQTLASKSDSAYGVHFTTSGMTLFMGDTYATTSSSNTVKNFSGRTRLTISLGGKSDVVFDRLTGETNATGTITVISRASSTQTAVITVYGTGIINVQ